MVSSARNAPEEIVVIFGISSTVEISTSRPTLAPRAGAARSGVTSGSIEREEQIAGGIQHAFGSPRLPAHPREVTGCHPSTSPMDSNRTTAMVSTMVERNHTGAPSSTAGMKRQPMPVSDCAVPSTGAMASKAAITGIHCARFNAMEPTAPRNRGSSLCSGSCSGHFGFARPSRWAGEPA